MPLTGRFTFRRTWTGKIVLQVEEERPPTWYSRKTARRWRDATMMDLAMPEMRMLIDLRYRPQFMAHRFQPGSEESLGYAEPLRDVEDRLRATH